MRFNDAVIGLILVVFGAAVLIYTRGFPTMEEGYPGPSLFPNVLAGLFIIAGMILTFRGLRSGKAWAAINREAFGENALLNILLVLASIVAYIFLAEIVGFLILSFCLLTIMMKWLRAGTKWSLIMSAGVTLGIYVLFAKFLLVPLPWGLFGW